jgi:putative endonuclease
VAEEVKGNLLRPYRIVDWLRHVVVGRRAIRDPKSLGRYGEDLASRELGRRGYRIIERRVRSRRGEIDIVAWDGPVLAFIEVKARRGNRFGSPLAAVDGRKQRKIIMLARSYMARKRLQGVPVRFDIVGVELDSGGKPHVELTRGAFQER